MTQGADDQRDAGLVGPEGAGAPSGASASAIVSAAERLADEIRRSAHADAEQIRARAGSESDAARAAIGERVRRLSGLADAMLERIQGMRTELDALAESVRGGATPVPAPEPVPAPVPVSGDRAQAAPVPPVVGGEIVTDPDEVAARLVALNMAMSDTPREEIARYLREHHSLADPERLLDEVYAGVGR